MHCFKSDNLIERILFFNYSLYPPPPPPPSLSSLSLPPPLPLQITMWMGRQKMFLCSFFSVVLSVVLLTQIVTSRQANGKAQYFCNILYIYNYIISLKYSSWLTGRWQIKYLSIYPSIYLSGIYQSIYLPKLIIYCNSPLPHTLFPLFNWKATTQRITPSVFCFVICCLLVCLFFFCWRGGGVFSKYITR